MTADLKSWIKSGEYLPDVMRDFHDQKDIFKTIHQTVNVDGHNYAKDVSWVAGQCYTIDIFLWWMAQHGYVLRRASRKRGYRDIHASVKDAKKLRDEQAIAVLKSSFHEHSAAPVEPK